MVDAYIFLRTLKIFWFCYYQKETKRCVSPLSICQIFYTFVEIFFVFIVVFSLDRLSPCSPETHYVDQTFQIHRDMPASVSQMLESKVWATIPGP